MFLVVLGVISLFISTFFIAYKKSDISVIDLIWAPACFLVYLLCFGQNLEKIAMREIILGLCLFVWSIRLSSYLTIRHNQQNFNDFRYAQIRQKWLSHFWAKSFFYIYMFQALACLVISSPFYFLMINQNNPLWGTWSDYMGLTLFFIGFIFESIADYQKHMFKKTSLKGEVFTEGVWNYSRHPNYFGEVTLWWGLGFICYSELSFIQSFISPAILTILILYFTGINLLENKYRDNTEFKKYKKKTSLFFPWFPKKEEHYERT